MTAQKSILMEPGVSTTADSAVSPAMQVDKDLVKLFPRFKKRLTTPTAQHSLAKFVSSWYNKLRYRSLSKYNDLSAGYESPLPPLVLVHIYR